MMLKSFKFSLETPLKVKKIRKMELESQLADAKNKMDAQRFVLEQLVSNESRLNSKLVALTASGIKADELRVKSQYLKFLGEKINYNRIEYLKLEETYRKYQKALIKLLNEIDILEKLKDKKLKEYLKGMEKQEERIIEEIINYKSSIQGG